ncbi:MAG: DNA polymerase/3'-5' exonuclease PolX, partial [Thermoguttaceae bacterium]|nr:DNA polymerase/3'-5' exonuclease PolX [Thermoguttaceae bacterium]
QSQSKIHRRYMDAFTNPYVDVIAHPTGRMIGTEEPIDVDVEFLCENAKKYGKCLELNCQPRRLDLDARALIIAKKYGVPIVVSTDAHAPDQMAYLQFGVQQAYRAGLTCDDVLNTLPVEEILKRRKTIKQKFGI